jgi:hypothetical protein
MNIRNFVYSDPTKELSLSLDCSCACAVRPFYCTVYSPAVLREEHLLTLCHCPFNVMIVPALALYGRTTVHCTAQQYYERNSCTSCHCPFNFQIVPAHALYGRTTVHCTAQQYYERNTCTSCHCPFNFQIVPAHAQYGRRTVQPSSTTRGTPVRVNAPTGQCETPASTRQVFFLCIL